MEALGAGNTRREAKFGVFSGIQGLKGSPVLELGEGGG